MQGRIEITVGIFVLAALCILAYMGFQVGAFRFDKARYREYTISFKDISGLSRKADVKIAGVKVGWVDDIKLHADGQLEPEVKIMLLKDYSLYSDSYALVRQQGLLGSMYLELIPGNPLMRKLESGETIGRPTAKPVAIDELLQQFYKIANNVQEVTESFKEVLGGSEGRNQLRNLFENLNNTAQRLASFSDVLERSFIRNEGNIDDFLTLGKDLRRVSATLENDVLPSFKNGLDRIATVFDHDFAKLANKLEATGVAVEEASIQARDGLKSLTSVAEKIDEGKGLLGKLINEDETYKDLKVAASGLRNYFAKVDRMQIVFDAHSESMHRPSDYYKYEDTKGFFDIRIHPTEDYFYLLQLVSSEKGYIDRHEVFKQYLDREGKWVDVSKLNLTDGQRIEFDFIQKVNIVNRNAFKWGLQFGKIFHDVAFRFGLFEGRAGLAFDIDIPTGTDKFRWVTSLEAYDFTGQNRIHDRRPHFKWLNRMFLFRSIYFTFGADDFASRHNANVFLGAGIRFGDDDVKFLLGSIGGGGLGGGGSAPYLTGSTVVGN